MEENWSIFKLFKKLLLPCSLLSIILFPGELVYSGGKAVIYIGPFLSSDTDMSLTVHRNFKILRSHKMFPLGKCEDAHLSIVSYLLNSTTVDGEDILSRVDDNCRYTEDEFIKFLQIHATKRHNIVLASNYFSKLTYSAVKRLKKLLKNYDVAIVMSYRMWNSRILLALNQESAKFSWPMRTFLDSHLNWLFSKEYWGNITETLRYKFGSHFGYERIRIIDTLGAKMQGKSVFEVFSCDVLKLDLACDEEGRFNRYVASVKEKVKKNQYIYQTFQLFLQFSFSYHCSFDLEDYHALLEHKWKVRIDQQFKASSTFVHHSLEMDKWVRRNNKILYDNETANHDAAYNTFFGQIDRNFVAISPQWRFEFIKTLKHFLDIGLAKCSGDIFINKLKNTGFNLTSDGLI